MLHNSSNEESKMKKEHSELIDRLGSNKGVIKILGGRVSSQSVSKWRQLGIPWKYRVMLRDEAERNGIDVPSDFLG